MSTTAIPGTRDSRKPVDLFGAENEAVALVGTSPHLASMIRNTLRYAASRTMFCPVTGNVLDMRTVVLVTVEGTVSINGVVATSPEAWMKSGPDTVAVVQKLGGTVKVLTRKHVDAAVRAAQKASA